MLTQTQLKEVIHYEPGTGVLTWVKARPRVVPGTRAGSKHHTGYRYVTVLGHAYPEHHIAWLYMTGALPSAFLDHRNRVKDDNRWRNLREASRKQNSENSLVRCDSVSGVRGVSWDSIEGKWRVYIYHNKKQLHLGYYKHKTKAARARREAEIRLFTHSPLRAYHVR